MEIPARHSIFLKGVFFDQIRSIEDYALEDSTAEQADFDAAQQRAGGARVTRFSSKKQWADAYKNAVLRCWYCGLNFRGVPCFIPRQIRNTTKGREYDAHGLFCGFACAFAFLNHSVEFVRDRTYSDKLAMLKMLFTRFYNRRAVEFREAPNVYDLASYGGPTDPVEYKGKLRAINAAIFAEARALRTDPDALV